VAQSHPDVSLQIWRSAAERRIDRVNPKAYLEAAVYLRQMHAFFQQTGRLAE
jgi:uncharacterized Zn finger protein